MFPYIRPRPIDQMVTKTMHYGELEITYRYSPSEDPDQATGYPGCESSYEVLSIMCGGIDIISEIEGIFQTRYNDDLTSICYDHHIATLPDY